MIFTILVGSPELASASFSTAIAITGERLLPNVPTIIIIVESILNSFSFNFPSPLSPSIYTFPVFNLYHLQKTYLLDKINQRHNKK